MFESTLELGAVVDLINAALYWILIALFLGVISKAIYNVYFHPLSRFPGPLLSVATPIPYAYHMLNGSLVDWLQSLHEKYGEIVRIHPTELSFVGPEALHDIFLSRPPLPRPLVGLLAPPTDADDMGATMNTEDHQRMRRVFHNSFSERALKQQEPFVQEHTDILIKRLQDLAEDAEKGSKEVDILEWYSFTSFDVIGDLLFGESFHALENSEQHPWVKTLFTYIKFGVRLTALNNLGPMQQVMRWCTPNSLAEKVATHKEFTRDRVDKRIAQGELRPDLMSEILQSRDQIGLSLGELYSNAALIVIAGAQTSALACGSVTWFLLKNPSAMKRLQKEIRGTFRSVKDITIASTAKLPYLRAVIQETLRLHPPSPLNMSREVDRPGVIVSGHEMPIGTRVCVPQKVINRLPQNFVKPFSYLPERWLQDGNPEFNADRKSVHEPFQIGPHSCLGRSLAWAEMDLILCKIFYSFDLDLIEERNPQHWCDAQKVYIVPEHLPLFIRIRNQDLK